MFQLLIDQQQELENPAANYEKSAYHFNPFTPNSDQFQISPADNTQHAVMLAFEKIHKWMRNLLTKIWKCVPMK